MSQHRIEAHEFGIFVDCGGLEDCDGVATEALAHDIKAARQWGIAESSPRVAWRRRADDGDE